MASIAVPSAKPLQRRQGNALAAVLASLGPALRPLLEALQRRLAEIAVVAGAVLIASPEARKYLGTCFRKLIVALRLRVAGLGRPAVRKDFLGDSAVRSWAEDESGDVWKVVSAAAKKGECPSFTDLNKALPDWLQKSLQREGFSQLKPIQKAVLPRALSGSDVIGIAPTGSGKTLAFLVPALVHMSGQAAPRRINDGPLALVLAPTRELVIQIASVAELLMRGGRSDCGGMRQVALYGGTRRSDQLEMLRRQKQTHLFVATPGRLLDFLEQKAFGLRLVSFFVLDEGDRMLDFGFQEDIQRISAEIRPDRQMLFFSATWPAAVEEAASRLCRSKTAQKVMVTAPKPWEATDEETDPEAPSPVPHPAAQPDPEGFTLPPREIRQLVEVVKSDYVNDSMRQKEGLLLQYLEEVLGTDYSKPPQGKALIFVKTRRAAEELGITVADYFGLERCGVMHGLRRQEQREATLKAFRESKIHALVCTDVMGRGLDIPDVTHVVIFDFPDDIETYVHRVGRTGRNGRPGTSIAFFEPHPWAVDSARELADVLRACGQEVPEKLAAEEKRHAPQSAEPIWGVSESASRQTAPALEGNVPFASAEELREWDAAGTRVWGYSADGGVSEQGRLELRAGGLLRTTWGFGQWSLVDVDEGLDDRKSRNPSARNQSVPCLTLTWSGTTDVVRLDEEGLGFDLVSRNGRPAHTFKKGTFGRALPGVTI